MSSSCCSSNVTPTPILDEIIALSGKTELSKESKDRLELKLSRLTQLADGNFDGVKELKVHSTIMDLCG
ncbi:hypothetical protein Tco_1216749 [Tanacetum coccineum]